MVRVNCCKCLKRINSQPSGNKLYIVPDGYGNYFCFDSLECCLSYFKKAGYNNYGHYQYEDVEKVARLMGAKPRWGLFRLHYKAIKDLINQQKEEDSDD